MNIEFLSWEIERKKNSGNLRTLQNNIKNDKFTGSLNNILEEPEEMTSDGKKKVIYKWEWITLEIVNGKIEKKIIILFKRQLTFYNKAHSIVLCGL